MAPENDQPALGRRRQASDVNVLTAHLYADVSVGRQVGNLLQEFVTHHRESALLAGSVSWLFSALKDVASRQRDGHRGAIDVDVAT